jgi:hypothetical protein
MNMFINITNSTVNIVSPSDNYVENAAYIDDSEKMELLVSSLRAKANDPFFQNRSVFIPDMCENYGFSEGHFNVAVMLQFLSDMLEE